MTRICSIILITLASLTSWSGARAQYHWHITHSGFSGPYLYQFWHISSAGQVVLASAVKSDTSLHSEDRNRTVFMRSTDAGETWSEQDPGLPHWRPDDNPYQIFALQQIDSMNAVAVGDSGNVVRTYDGGATWIRQDLHTKNWVYCVHFSDPMTGIAVLGGQYGADSVDRVGDIYTTHDGGQHWIHAPFSTWIWCRTCHADGGASFRVIPLDGYGPVYRTADNWNSHDSTPWVLPWGDTEHMMYGFQFTGTDTIIGSGGFSRSRLNFQDEPLYAIVSTDGGRSWAEAAGLSDTTVNNARGISPLDHSVVFLAMTSRKSGTTTKIGVSKDHGMSWQLDPLQVDTSFISEEVIDITTTPEGHAIGIFSGGYRLGAITVSSECVLMRGDPVPMNVVSKAYPDNNTYLYPNPASSACTINSSEIRSFIHLVDVIGREVLRSIVPEEGRLTLDVSSLPRGIYEVMIEHDGQMVPAGKVALIGP